MSTDPIIGIDLGTTNSVAARCDDTGAPVVLADEHGRKIHPSVVSFHPNGSVVVGAEAKQRRIIDPRNTVFSAKRLIGRAFRSREIHAAMQRMPYAIKEGANQQPVIVTRGGEFAVPEISAIVLDHVRTIAGKALGREVNRAVVTVPASFNDAQRSATATAGAIAGITVVRVLNEPTAAALAYGHARKLSRVIAVYDFGGGTFDVTILRLQDQVYEVLATAGDSFLGGDDIDEILMEHMADVCLSKLRTDVRTNEVAVMRLRAVAEQAKIELSRRQRALVKVDEIAYGAGGAPLHLETEITRDQLVTQAVPLIERSFAVCEEALTLAGLSPSAIEDVVLVGGTTKIPHVRERVTQFFQRAPRSDLDAEEAVALGAALQAAALERILSKRTTGRPLTPGTGVAVIPPIPQPPATTAAEAAGDSSWDDATTDAGTEKRTTAPMGALPRDGGGSHLRPPARAVTADRFDDPAGVRPARPTNRGPAIPPIPTASARQRTMVGVTLESAVPGSGSIDVGPLHLDPPTASRAVEGLAENWELEEPTTPPAPPPAPPPSPPPVSGPGARTLIGAEAPVLPVAGARTLIGAEAGGPTGSGPPPIPRGTPDARTLITTAPDRPPERITERGPQRQRPPAAGPGSDERSTHAGAEPPPIPPPSSAPARTATDPRFPAAPPSPAAAQATLVGAAPDVFAVTTTPGVPLAPPVPPAAGAPISVSAARLIPPAPRSPVVVEVVPRGLGIGTVAGYCEELIRRNARVPAETRRMFATSRDQQQTVRIRVFQGESRRIDENNILGDLVLDNLPARPRGATSIEVIFAVDPSGILRVRARDAQTGQEQQANLDLVGTQSPAEVDAARERFVNLRR